MKDELQEQLDELIAHHLAHHDKETRFLQRVVDLETTIAYNEATIADLERERDALLSQCYEFHHCGRCGEEIERDDAEVCWWCGADLCVECWETVGHCGHPEADELNERMRAWYAEHEQEVKG